MTTEETELFCYPVEWKENLFVAVPLPEVGLLLPTYSEMEARFQSHYEKKLAYVDIDGKRRKSFVFCPKVAGLSYVLVDDRFELAEIAESDDKSVGDSSFATYLNAVVRDRLSHAESIGPGHKPYLWSGFLAPNLQRLRQDDTEREIPDTAPASWEELLSLNRVIITGHPGAGKTTLCRRLALQLADQMQDGSVSADSFPAYCALRKWDFSVGAMGNVRRQIANIDGGGQLVDSIEELGKSGRILVVFDGLDEVLDEKRSVVKNAIEEFADEYTAARIFLTCRPSVLGRKISGFEHFRLKPFLAPQINELIRISIPDDRRFEWFISRLWEERELLELASNPLMLRTMVRHFDLPDGNPRFVTGTLKACIWMLLLEWDSVRGVRRYTNQDDSPSKNMAWLQRLAIHLLDNGKSEIQLEDLDAATSNFAGEKPKDSLLHLIESHTG